MKKTLLIFAILILLIPFLSYGQCGTDQLQATDNDGNTYSTLKIESHCWLKPNLQCKVIGSSIYYSYEHYDTIANLSNFGRLYTWPAATQAMLPDENGFIQGVCPTGWHLPIETEVRELAQNNVKDIRSVDFWLKSTGTNITGFDLRPGGLYRGSSSRCENLLGEAYFWMLASDMTPKQVWSDCYCDNFIILPAEEENRLSVRCVYRVSAADVVTGEASNIGMVSSVLTGEVISAGLDDDYVRGFQYGQSTDALDNTISENAFAEGEYTLTVETLIPNTKYYYRAYVVNDFDTAYGMVKTFVTTFDSLATLAATNVTKNSATLNGEVLGMGVSSSKQVGFRYGQHKSYMLFRTSEQTLTAKGTFAIGLTNISPNTTYYFQAYAADGTDTIWAPDTLTFTTFTNPCLGLKHSNEDGVNDSIVSVTDHQGNSYVVVQIGTQCWMAENLRVTTSPRQGTGPGQVNLQQGTSSKDFGNPLYYDYNATSGSWAQKVTNLRDRGYLYNWAAAMDTKYTETTRPGEIFDFQNHRGICPEGWHLPTDSEWTKLAANAGVGQNSGTGLGKLIGGADWITSSAESSPGNYSYAYRNSTGFSLLPVGYFTGQYYYSSYGTQIWTATSCIGEFYIGMSYTRMLYPNHEDLASLYTSEDDACPIRCLRDTTIGTITFVSNGGTGTMDKQTFVRGETTTINDNAFTHEGNWEYLGWNDAYDGSGTTYADKANITTNNNVTLYAQWHTWCTGTPRTSINEYGTSRIDSVKDHQNNNYKVVQIGSQCWLKENMRCSTSPRQGTGPGQVDLQLKTSGLNFNNPYYYDYTEASQFTLRKRGYLYNWVAAMDTMYASSSDQPEWVDFPNRRGICPEGWHLPIDAEWTELATYVGIGESLSGTGAGKLTGGGEWLFNYIETSPGDYSYADRNSTGLTVLPVGYFGGSCQNAAYTTAFWTATSDFGLWAWYRHFSYNEGYMYSNSVQERLAISVRCLRDNTGIILGTVSKTDSTATTLNISAAYTGDSTITSATICAYTDSTCTTPASNCAADVAFASSPITGTITGLTPSTKYYVMVTATTAGGTERKIAGPFWTAAPSLAITSDSAATIKICGDTTIITYAAVVDGATPLTYAWTVTGGVGDGSTGNTFVVKAPIGTVQVSCTASALTAGKTTTVQQLSIPSITTCEECDFGKSYVKAVDNVSVLEYVPTSGTTITVNNPTTSTITTLPTGIYTMRITSSDGCQVEKTVSVVKQYTHCTVGAVNANESGVGTQLDSVKDHQGNWYEVVEIGMGPNKQCWLKENMRATTSPREGMTMGSNTMRLTKGTSESLYTPYYYDYITTSGTYPQKVMDLRRRGYLYNWAAAIDTITNAVFNKSYTVRRGICPEGWHIPTDAEWTTLAINAGTSEMEDATGMGRLASGCEWLGNKNITSPNSYSYDERNVFGFSALPIGYFYKGGLYYSGYIADFWTADSDGSNYAWGRHFNLNWEYILRSHFSKGYGFTVRCLRDDSGITLGAVSKTDSTGSTLSISAEYSGDKAVTSATVCAYTDESCTTPAGECAADVAFASSPITGTITGLTPNTQYYVKITTTTANGTVNKVAGPFGTKEVIIDTITFVANGGTGTMAKQTVTRGETTAISTNAYTHTGNWIFTGWNDACDGNGTTYDNNDNITTSGNVTLYANWHTWCTGTPNITNESGDSRIDSVKDHQDHWYKVVEINGQCWLKENMRATTSPSGNLQQGDGTSLYLPYYYDYTAASQLTLRERGYLYNWAAALDTDLTSATFPNNPIEFKNRRGICPSGWHLPTQPEWKILLDNTLIERSTWDTPDYIDSYYGSGSGKLIGGCDWSSYTDNATCPGNYSYADRNSSGFSALPVGRSFYQFAGFWSANAPKPSGPGAYDPPGECAMGDYFHYQMGGVSTPDYSRRDARLSVRCLRN